MNLSAPVSSIMTKEVMILTPTSSLSEAGKIFESKNIHHIPVVSAGELVGILSSSDFLAFKNWSEEDMTRLANTNVEVVMTKGLAKLEPQDKIIVAVDLFAKNLFHALPVVEGDRLVGIVTTHDIIKQLAAE